MSDPLVVPEALDGQRADVVVAALLDVSRSRAAALIVDGAVTRDGSTLRRSERLATGDRVTADLPEPDVEDGAGVPVPPIRHEDYHLLVLAKPILRHRMALTFAARADGVTIDEVIDRLCAPLS